jgi:hypothetical protein
MLRYKKFLESSDHINDILNIARDEGLKVERISSQSLTIWYPTDTNGFDLIKISRYDDMVKKMASIRAAARKQATPRKIETLVSDEKFLEVVTDIINRLKQNGDLQFAQLSYYNLGNFATDGTPDWPKQIDFEELQNHEPIVDIFHLKIALI